MLSGRLEACRYARRFLVFFGADGVTTLLPVEINNFSSAEMLIVSTSE